MPTSDLKTLGTPDYDPRNTDSYVAYWSDVSKRGRPTPPTNSEDMHFYNMDKAAYEPLEEMRTFIEQHSACELALRSRQWAYLQGLEMLPGEPSLSEEEKEEARNHRWWFKKLKARVPELFPLGFRFENELEYPRPKYGGGFSEELEWEDGSAPAHESGEVERVPNPLCVGDEESKRGFYEKWAGPVDGLGRYVLGLEPSAGEESLEEYEKEGARRVVRLMEEFEQIKLGVEYETRWEDDHPLTKEPSALGRQKSLSAGEDAGAKRTFEERWAGPMARQTRYNQGLEPLPGEPPLSEDEKMQARGLAQIMEEIGKMQLEELAKRSQKDNVRSVGELLASELEDTCNRVDELVKLNDGKGPIPR